MTSIKGLPHLDHQYNEQISEIQVYVLMWLISDSNLVRTLIPIKYNGLVSVEIGDPCHGRTSDLLCARTREWPGGYMITIIQ